MKLLISVLLIVHGLIVAGQSAGSFGATIPNEVPKSFFHQLVSHQYGAVLALLIAWD